VYPEHAKQGATVIVVDPDVLSGTAVFAGTHVPAQALLEYLEGGRSRAEFLADFPIKRLVFGAPRSTYPTERAMRFES
jgi:uncharacterized protein (DUF433 family)